MDVRILSVAAAALLVGCGGGGPGGGGGGNPNPYGPGGSTDMATPTAGCGTAASPIEVGNFSFSPATCQVAAGATVFWKVSTGPHTVTSDGTGFDSGMLGSGASFTAAVPAGAASGTRIPYHCTIHATVASGACSGMCAQLTVK